MARTRGLVRSLLRGSGEESVEQLREKLGRFRSLVEKNDRVLELIAQAGEMLGGEYVFDRNYLEKLVQELSTAVHGVVGDLNTITRDRYPELLDVLASVDARLEAALEGRAVIPDAPHLIPLVEIGTEHAEMVGEKLARLGELRSRLGCRIPEGFVITTRSCQEFLEEAGIPGGAGALRALLEAGGEGVEVRVRMLQERVLRSRLPRALARSIRRAVDRLQERAGCQLLAVRSSAVGEDGEFSFAGQYTTALGVEAEDVVDTYRRVVASLFSPGVIQYHRHHDVPLGCGLMAVGVLCMIPARASGVVYSLNPTGTRRDVQLVSAAWGLGKLVVEGEAEADRFEVLRKPGYPVMASHVADKTWKYAAIPGRGLVREAVPEEERNAPSLTVSQVSELAEVACRIERYMKAAQDIEWAVDGAGRLVILQARPLSVALPEDTADLSAIVAGYRVLLEGRGEVACRGIGSGPVHILRDGEVLEQVPPGAVVVARSATPRLGAVLAGASAVVTDLGNATGHFAAVARDFRVPTIVAAETATRDLETGVEVTVDAEENVVYEGRVDELLRYQLMKRSSFEDTTEFRTLRRMLRRIAPLTLPDPQNAGFTATSCRTYHDVIRFAHEKAIAELMEIGWVKPSRGGPYVRRLDLPIPLDLILIDLGGGFRTDPERTRATPRDVTCRPLVPLVGGLTGTNAWETAPADIDLDGFMSSATRSMSFTGPLGGPPDQNLALVSDEWLHLNLRLGYHFNIVDVHLGDEPRDNYIYFRFLGGVTEITRRSRRATLLKRILEQHGFVTEGRGDLVIGRVKGLSTEVMIERLEMLGRLIAFTRQLDIFLKSDRLVDEHVDRFMKGQPVATPKRPEMPTEVGMSSSGDVLVLDDEPVVGERLKDHLERKGFQVEVFERSQEAIDRLAQKRFDVVITDLKMEGPTGLDVLDFVRDEGRGTQVIIITGYGSMEAARRAEYGNAFEFVHKPFNMKAIEAMTRKATRRARKLRDRKAT